MTACPHHPRKYISFHKRFIEGLPFHISSFLPTYGKASDSVGGSVPTLTDKLPQVSLRSPHSAQRILRLLSLLSQ